ncbi:hypothetical protein HZC09_00700 [Candidatus Micrarchaeota archaeon]|nr:hypothetical protein [Candidatus Micrarchaeota archaeon]
MVDLRKLPMRKRVLTAISLLGVFLLLVLVITYRYSVDSRGMPLILAPLVFFHLELMVIVAIAGLLSGAGVFYLLSEAVEEQRKESGITGTLLLKSLEPSEAKVVGALVRHNNSIYQSQLSRLEGFTRLKAHRTLDKLERKGLINVEKIGKTNLISLAKELYDALKSGE